MKISWPKKSLSSQLMIYSVLFTYLLLLGFWTILFLSVKHGLKQQDEGLLKDRIHTITSLLERAAGGSPQLRQRIEKEWYERNYERILVRVLDPQGLTVAETPHLSPDHAQVLKNLDETGPARDGQSQLRRFETGKHIYQAALAEVLVNGEKYRVEVAVERTSEQNILSQFEIFFLYVLLIGGAASLWIGRAIVGIALRPIRRVSEIAAQINSDRLNERIQPHLLPTEFHELAETMNQMLERLSENFTRLTRFSEDMAHELRTPVNNLMGSMEVALSRERSPDEYRNIIGSGIEECDRLKRIIESLLFVARSADPSHAIEKQKLQLADELADIVSFYDISAEEKKIALRLEVDPEISLMANRTDFQRCLGNLLSNSIRHSPEKSKIVLRVENFADWVTVNVIDVGCGIPKASLKQIGERFFRVEASRSKLYGGTGLGLSIVKSIVEMHSGKMEVQSSEGFGTTVTLYFPA